MLNLSASSAGVLPFSQGITLLSLVVGGSLAAGVIVIWGRRAQSGSGSDSQSSSIIRSWISITLVLALVVFCAGAFLIEDSNLRSTLFGGLIASVGAAVAFYFSSKSADQARADVLNAAVAMSQGSGTKPSAFTESSPPSGQVGQPYSYRFAAIGLPAPTYALVTGDAPAGLTLDSDGTLQGTPTTAGSTSFTVAASNSIGHLVSQPITITITGS